MKQVISEKRGEHMHQELLVWKDVGRTRRLRLQRVSPNDMSWRPLRSIGCTTPKNSPTQDEIHIALSPSFADNSECTIKRKMNMDLLIPWQNS